MSDIRYRSVPQTPGQIIDAVLMDRLGLIDGFQPPRTDALCSSEGMDRYGQWGVYLLRELPDDDPSPQFPMQIWDLNIHVGAGNVGSDNQVTDRIDKTIFGGLTQQLIGFQMRGLAIPVSGDQVRVSCRWQPAFPGGRITTVDNVKAWISPGAPQSYRIPFSAVANQFPPVVAEVTPLLRIPPFAQSLKFWKSFSTPYPVWVAFGTWRNVAFGGVVADSATQLVPGNNEIGIPPNARFMTFIDSQGTPPPAVFSQLTNVHGYFECYG